MTEEKRSYVKASPGQIEIRKLVSKDFLIENYFNYRSFLNDVYQKVSASQEKYSWKTFSVDLGLADSNNLYLVVMGERKLSDDFARTIAQALQLKKKRRLFFLTLVEYEDETKDKLKVGLHTRLSRLRSEILADTDTPLMLEFLVSPGIPLVYEYLRLTKRLCTCDEFNKHSFLRLTPKKFEHALEVLRKLDFISGDVDNFDVRHVRLKFGPEISEFAAQTYHKAMQSIALDAAERVPVPEKYFSNGLICVNVAEFERIETSLREAYEKIFALDGEGEDKKLVAQVGVFSFVVAKKEQSS